MIFEIKRRLISQTRLKPICDGRRPGITSWSTKLCDRLPPTRFPLVSFSTPKQETKQLKQVAAMTKVSRRVRISHRLLLFLCRKTVIALVTVVVAMLFPLCLITYTRRNRIISVTINLGPAGNTEQRPFQFSHG